MNKQALQVSVQLNVYILGEGVLVQYTINGLTAPFLQFWL